MTFPDKSPCQVERLFIYYLLVFVLFGLWPPGTD